MRAATQKAASGSVGTVDTQFLDLPHPLALDCGTTLHPVRIAYETYGTLSAARDNVILVCHALSGDAHAAGFAAVPPVAGTRDGFRAEERDGSQGGHCSDDQEPSLREGEVGVVHHRSPVAVGVPGL